MKMSSVINNILYYPFCPPCTHHFERILTLWFYYRSLFVIIASFSVNVTLCTLGLYVVLLAYVIYCPHFRKKVTHRAEGEYIALRQKSGRTKRWLVRDFFKIDLSDLLQVTTGALMEAGCWLYLRNTSDNVAIIGIDTLV